MNRKRFLLSLWCIGLAGPFSCLQAADRETRAGIQLPYDIAEPSLTLAERYQKRGDYATAVLLYEAILNKEATNQEAFRAMIQCHEALAKKTSSGTIVNPPPLRKETDDDGLSDLPHLIATDALAKNGGL